MIILKNMIYSLKMFLNALAGPLFDFLGEMVIGLATSTFLGDNFDPIHHINEFIILYLLKATVMNSEQNWQS